MTLSFSSDAEVIELGEAFLRHTLPADRFNHQAHCVVTLYLLWQRPYCDVQAELPNLIRSCNVAVGGRNTDAAGYHQTITMFNLSEIDKFRRSLPGGVTLADACNKLLASPASRKDFIFGWYSRERLYSMEARRHWIAPDLTDENQADVPQEGICRFDMKRTRSTLVPMKTVTRVQTGVRVEARLIKVLKALAEYKSMSLGDLLEGIVLHAFDGKQAFSPETRQKINDLKKIYKLGLSSEDSHKLREHD